MYYFFFSYSRDNNNDFLKTFYTDLDSAVKGLVGDQTVSFIDQTGNEPGDLWEENLEQALASSRVFIAIATASYCKKPYCGKEWAAFQTRIASYSRAKGLEPLAPLALPLLWIPPAENIAPFPDEIRARHFHVDDPALISNRKGVFYLTKLKAKFLQEYEDLISALASRIVNLAGEHQDIDAYSAIPRLASLESPFLPQAMPPVVGTAMPTSRTGGGPKRVYFVYGAGTPAEAREVGRVSVEAYGENGGVEWQPFFPEQRTLGEIAQHVASSDHLGMISEELPLSSDLDDKVRKLEEMRRLVVILLDCWTTKMPKYQQALRRFDRRNYINCSVLLLRNSGDEETKNSWPVLDQSLRSTLFYRFKNSNDLFLRCDIQEESHFRAQIEDVLTRLRAEVINHTEPDLTMLPAGGARPSVSGPGAANE